MHETMLVLERSIGEDLEAIDGIFAALAPVSLDRGTPQEECIVVGYRLHNLYNAFENIFKNIAHAFENSFDERAGWHVELLRRMRLDLMPIRPPVIDTDAFDKLDELRRFRHVFRSLYTSELDPLRMTVALGKAHELRQVWPAKIAVFLGFVEGLRSASPPAEDRDGQEAGKSSSVRGRRIRRPGSVRS